MNSKTSFAEILKEISKIHGLVVLDNDLRIIFKFLDYENTQAILLESIGSHDAVY